MDTEKILIIIEQLLADFCMAKSCLNCEAEISSRIVNEEKIVHEDFFYLQEKLSIHRNNYFV